MSPIPSQVHLVWLGPRLGALGYLSVRAALDRGGLETVTLHYDTPGLLETPELRDLEARPGFHAVPVNVPALAACDASSPGGLSPETWERLATLDGLGLSPAIRSDLHRLELLWVHGGVYLDTDAIVLQSLRPLLDVPAFTGTEQICFPMRVKGGRNPLLWAHASVLTTLRAAIRGATVHPSLPFQRLAPFLYHVPMGAVSGAKPRHPLWRALLERAAALPDAEARRPNRLGPWLFQEVIGTAPRPDIYQHEPAAFYPFPPEISVGYIRPDPARSLGDTPHPDTIVAHLWDSVLKAEIGHAVGADDLRRFRGSTLLGRLVEPYLDDLFALKS